MVCRILTSTDYQILSPQTDTAAQEPIQMNDKQVAGLGNHRAHNILLPSSNCCDYASTIDYVFLMLATTSFEDEHHKSMVVAVVSTLIVV